VAEGVENGGAGRLRQILARLDEISRRHPT
jgi:hypothetical protein